MIKETKDKFAKKRRILKIKRFFKLFPLPHDCNEAIVLLGAPLMIDWRIYAECPICNHRFPISFSKPNIKK